MRSNSVLEELSVRLAVIQEESSWMTANLTLNSSVFDEYLSFSDQITATFTLRCIRPFLDIKTASNIATSIVHSKLDYYNSLYYNLPNSQLSRLQHIQNSLTRAVVKAPKFSHTTPIFKSLHWLKINERIEYKILSLTYKTLSTAEPAYLHNLISVQPPGRTRSSSLITIARPPSSSSLKITDRSFRYACIAQSLE